MKYNSIKAYIRENKGKCLKATGIALVLILALTVYLSGSLRGKGDIIIQEAQEVNAEETAAAEAEESAPEEKETIIVVDIEGAVKTPGIVRLPEGSRVNDAVEQAGGLTDKADTMGVNLAAKLADGDKVYIPKEKEQKSASTEPAGIVTNTISGNQSGSQSAGSNAGASGESENSLININTANSGQLQALSGVGPATAQKIIDYRESSGGFKKIEDIMKVSGIGTKTYQKLKDKITV